MITHVLVAAPGTGKTTKIISKIKTLSDPSALIAISFTNSTVRKLRADIKRKAGIEISDDKCTTLHALALRLASAEKHYVVTEKEMEMLQNDSKKSDISYEDICIRLKCKDFNQVIHHAIEFISRNPVLVQDTLGGVGLLLVDEYQDFNIHEQELIFRLSEFIKETWVLGDDDQAIYEFKNANPNGIIDLGKDTTNKKIEHEGKCWRCPDAIVLHAKKLIENNKLRFQKPWIATGKPGTIRVAQFRKKDDEVDAIISEIKNIINVDKKEKRETSILVLYSIELASHTLKQKMEENGIDFNIYNKNNKPYLFLRHLISLILLRNPFLHLRLLLGTLDKIQTKNFYEVLDLFIKNGNSLLSVEELKNLFVKHKKLHELVSGVISPIEKVNPNDIKKLITKQEHSELLTKIGDIDDPELILKAINRMIEQSSENEVKGVELMSIHKSKGLEAENVFIMGVTDGVLPLLRKGTTMEGQRRLMYVAVTRALKNVYISSAYRWELGEGKVNKVDKGKFKYDHIRKIWSGSLSPFITEMGVKVNTSFA